MHTSRKRHGLRAIVGAGLVGLLAMTGAQAAMAAPTVDEEATGSVTVHKHQQTQDPSTTVGTGLEQSVDPSVHPPIQNIQFTAYEINGVDLTENSGWGDLAELKEGFDPYDAPDYGLGGAMGAEAGQGRTAADGTVTFGDLPVGAYLVVETDWANPLDAAGNPLEGGITPALPFIITVPMTHPENLNDWVYDVHVYPKNPVSSSTKTVTDADAVTIGDEIEYTILADIPSGVDTSAYRVRDTFDPKLTHVSTEVYFTGTDPETLLVEGIDYELDVQGQVVDVNITGALENLRDWAATGQIKVVHTATVNEAGEIANDPQLFPNGPSVENDTPVPGTGVTTKFGNIVIEKVDEDGNALPGAVFSVFLTEEDARAGTNPISIDDETRFTSLEDGIALISGLRYSNWADGEEVGTDDPRYRTYWIAEVEAPEGYELLANPVEVHVISDSTTDVTANASITNVPKNGGFELPNTGAAGSAMFVVAGLLIAAGGAAMLARRKNTQA